MIPAYTARGIRAPSTVGCASSLRPRVRPRGTALIPPCRRSLCYDRGLLADLRARLVAMAQHASFSTAMIDCPRHAVSFGARLRPRASGRETTLVDEFLERLEVRLSPGCCAAIFREPHLECGVPDLVIAVWHLETARRWEPERAKVDAGDLRVLQYMLNAERTDDADLYQIFNSRLMRSINRLDRAGMIRRVRDRWVPRSLRYNFALRRLISVEAKATDRAPAIEQAFRNLWFATDSLVLFPRAPRSVRVHEYAKAMSVGLVTLDAPAIDARTRSESRQPKCYASWLFNEWAWRDFSGGQDDGD